MIVEAFWGSVMPAFVLLLSVISNLESPVRIDVTRHVTERGACESTSCPLLISTPLPRYNSRFFYQYCLPHSDLSNPPNHVQRNNNQNKPLLPPNQTSFIRSTMSPAKDETVAAQKTNLPLPEDPAAAPVGNTADSHPTDVGAGNDGSHALRGPLTAGSSVKIKGSEIKQKTAGGDAGEREK